MDHLKQEADRRVATRNFIRTTFGLRGTLRLHRAAFGADLLRAPANVLLAPLFLLTRLAALLTKVLRFHKASAWLARRRVLLETDVSRQVAALIVAFFADLDTRGLGVAAPHDVVEHEVAEYTGVRSAVAEMTTTFFVLVAGYFLFHSATPGVISLVGPVAEFRAHSLAVEKFPLGQGLGRMYYNIFSTELTFWPLVGTGVVLAMIASVVTTFAGVVVDPLQVLTGTHRRRLSRLFIRLDVVQRSNSGVASEHIAARMADLSDMTLNIWRVLRG